MAKPIGIYLRILRGGFVSSGTRRKATRAGARLAEITDKNMKTALTTCLLKLTIPVSFLISPGIYRMRNQHHLLNTGKANFDFLQFITIENSAYDVIR